MTGFLALALALIVAAAAAVVVPLIRDRDRPAPVAAALAALALPVAAILLYASVSSYPWRAGLPAAPGPQEQPAAQAANGPDLATAEGEVKAKPDDLDAWLALGEAYVEANRFPDALTAFTRADRIASGASPDARLGMAEAQILSDREAARGKAGELVEEILLLAPESPKALWYGGMVALARGDVGAARTRWRRLLELSPPQPVRHVLEQQLARLDATTNGAAVSPASPAGKPTAAAAGNGIAVEIAVAEELRGRLRADAPLFLIARDPGRPGPPVAVVRRSAADLPLRLEISDANVMVPGQSLGALAEIRLTARISARGDPMAGPGDIYGEVLWSRVRQGKDPVTIRMDRVVGGP